MSDNRVLPSIKQENLKVAFFEGIKFIESLLVKGLTVPEIMAVLVALGRGIAEGVGAL